MTNLAQAAKIVPVLEPQDHNAGVDGDSVNTAVYNHWAFIFLFGELTGDAILTMNSGATVGVKTTAETFRYRATATDLKNAGGDTLGAEATSAALTLTAATYNSRLLIVEVEAEDMDMVAGDEEWLTLVLSNAASAGILHVVAVLEPRYKSNVSVTALT